MRPRPPAARPDAPAPLCQQRISWTSRRGRLNHGVALAHRGQQHPRQYRLIYSSARHCRTAPRLLLAGGDGSRRWPHRHGSGVVMASRCAGAFQFCPASVSWRRRLRTVVGNLAAATGRLPCDSQEKRRLQSRATTSAGSHAKDGVGWGSRSPFPRRRADSRCAAPPMLTPQRPIGDRFSSPQFHR